MAPQGTSGLIRPCDVCDRFSDYIISFSPYVESPVHWIWWCCSDACYEVALVRSALGDIPRDDQEARALMRAKGVLP